MNLMVWNDNNAPLDMITVQIKIRVFYFRVRYNSFMFEAGPLLGNGILYSNLAEWSFKYDGWLFANFHIETFEYH